MDDQKRGMRSSDAGQQAMGSGVGKRAKELVLRMYAVDAPLSLSMVRRPIAISAPVQSKPNKAPEPTYSPVMSRAIVSVLEMKHKTEIPNQARATPAEAVAHL